MHVLFIEDDAELLNILQRGFLDERIHVSTARNFADGQLQVELGEFDVIVLDVMLPGGSGFELCDAIRREGYTTPVLMLTALAAIDDRVKGLEGGADDYLTKPFAFRELLARVRALARRAAALTEDCFDLEDLHVELGSRRVVRAGRSVRLTTKEWDLLELFVRHHDTVIDRAAISAYVWDENHDPFSNVVEVLIGRLRRKIDADHPVRLIHTIRGAGYRFGV
jgi:two-component system copper resistance phosphate regulon response regulator CusR